MPTTKTGDKGKTDIYKQRVDKFDCRIDSLGNVDELIAIIIQLECQIHTSYKEDLKLIVQDLSTICSIIANYPQELSNERLVWLETKIEDYKVKDEFTFIYPFDQPLAALINTTRTITRRAERSILKDQTAYPDLLFQYMNRLSDYFYALTRKISYEIDK